MWMPFILMMEGKSKGNHISCLQQIMGVLSLENLYVSLKKKSLIMIPCIIPWGFVAACMGVECDPSKVKFIFQGPKLTNLLETCHFHGL